MKPSCARWAELSERQTLEEPLREDELHFLVTHERECDLCRQEAALLRDLRPGALHVVESEDEVQRILARADSAGADDTRLKGGRLRGSGARVLAATGFVSVAAAALLFWTEAGTRFRDPASAAAPSATAALVQTSADSCAALLEGVVVCLTAGSEVRRIELSGPDRGLDLSRGRALISVAAPAAGASFTVSTAAGSVVGSGGVFSVEAHPDGATWARATSGVAVVRSKGAHAVQTLPAGRALRLGESADTALSVEEAERERELLDRWKKVVSRARP
jgi:ferric-dicitrate binding protein FerR (iron transport regulator)